MTIKSAQLLAVAMLLSVAATAMAGKQDNPAGTEAYTKKGEYHHPPADYYPEGSYNKPHDYPPRHYEDHPSYPSYGDYPKECKVGSAHSQRYVIALYSQCLVQPMLCTCFVQRSADSTLLRLAH